MVLEQVTHTHLLQIPMTGTNLIRQLDTCGFPLTKTKKRDSSFLEKRKEEKKRTEVVNE